MKRYALLAAALLLAGAVGLSSMFGVYVYPAKGQSALQQQDDESECYKWAKSLTGIDPANLPPATPAPTVKHQGGGVKSAARGAAAGAVFGAITGNAGEGAAVGALSGAIFGRQRQRELNEAELHYAQTNAQNQRSAQMNDFRRAFSVCLEGKGYSVK
jgi:Glycine-zipper domain